MGVIISSKEARNTRTEYIKWAEQSYTFDSNEFLPWQIRNIRAVRENLNFEKTLHTKFNIAQRVILLIQYFENRAIDRKTGKVKQWGHKDIKINSYKFKWKTRTKKSGELTGERAIFIADLARISGGCTSYIARICQLIYSGDIDMVHMKEYIKALYHKFKKSEFLRHSIFKLIKCKFVVRKQKEYKNSYDFWDNYPIDDPGDCPSSNSSPPIYEYKFEDQTWWKRNKNEEYAMWGFADEKEIPQEILDSHQSI